MLLLFLIVGCFVQAKVATTVMQAEENRLMRFNQLIL